jgi:hypothetical protein
MLMLLSFLAIYSAIGSPVEGQRRMISSSSASCDLQGFLKSVDVPSGSIGLTTSGQTEELSQVLVPTSLNVGAYDVTVTRKGQDLYLVDGTSTYIHTRYCYEYSYSQRAILRNQGSGTFASGSLIFE